MPTPAIRPGICSVTLRGSSPEEIVELCVAAGLSVIEWGADVHVPPGSLSTAEDVRQLTEGAGLVTGSYGSYYRAGVTSPDEFGPVLDSARRLGAERIRIWAGDVASNAVRAEQRRAIRDATRDAADQASAHGIELAFEYHDNSLADTPASTVRLLEEVDRPTVSTYWQPPIGMSDDDALRDFAEVLPHLAALHVFSWWPGITRQPLAARSELWRGVLARVAATGRTLDGLLEFVVDDDPEQVVDSATRLHEWNREALDPTSWDP